MSVSTETNPSFKPTSPSPEQWREINNAMSGGVFDLYDRTKENASHIDSTPKARAYSVEEDSKKPLIEDFSSRTQDIQPKLRSQSDTPSTAQVTSGVVDSNKGLSPEQWREINNAMSGGAFDLYDSRKSMRAVEEIPDNQNPQFATQDKV